MIARLNPIPKPRSPVGIEAAREERELLTFNRLISKAASRASRETAAALKQFHRGIADQIRRAR